MQNHCLTALLVFVSFGTTMAQKQGEIVINEIYINPSDTSSNPNSLFWDAAEGSNPYGWQDDAEGVELFNTHPCEEKDISCYTIASHQGFITLDLSDNWGAFTFPPGTTIPPLSHITMGGNASGTTFNLNDYYDTEYFDMPNKGQGNIWDPNANAYRGGGGRWYLRNMVGWIALYDDTGEPVNAVWWAQNPNTTLTSADFAHIFNNRVIANSGCDTNGLDLMSIKEIFERYPDRVTRAIYVGTPDKADVPVARIVDGGDTWGILDAPTVNDCNTICLSPHEVNHTLYPLACPGDEDAYVDLLNRLEYGNDKLPASEKYWGWMKDLSDDATYNATWIAPNVDGIPINANSSIEARARFTDLAPGDYRLFVKDEYDCIDSITVRVDSVTPLEYELATTVPLCPDDLASIELTNVDGYNRQFVIELNGNQVGSVNGVAPANFTFPGLQGGNYELRFIRALLDGRSCEEDTNVVLESPPEPIELDIDTRDFICPTDPSGFADINNFRGGTFPWDFTLTHQTTNQVIYRDGQVQIPGLDLNLALQEGNYQIDILDLNNCPAQFNFEILRPDEMDFTLTKNDYTCSYSTDGFLMLSNWHGGTPAYTFEIYDDNNDLLQVFTPGLDIFKRIYVPAGTYEVLMKDSRDCEIPRKTEIIFQPDTLDLTIEPQDILCPETPSIDIRIEHPEGGTPDYDLDVRFTNGQIVTSYSQISSLFQDDVALSKGNYLAILTDANNCQGTFPFEIDQPELIEIRANITERPICLNDDGKVEVISITGGNPGDYTFSFVDNADQYLVNNKVFEPIEEIDGLYAGDYTIIARDSAGCEEEKVVSVTPIRVPVTQRSEIVQGYCDEEGSLKVYYTGDHGPVTINWLHNGLSESPVDSSIISTSTLDTNAQYDYQIIDIHGCEETFSVNYSQRFYDLKINSTIESSKCEEDRLAQGIDLSGKIELEVEHPVEIPSHIDPEFTYRWLHDNSSTTELDKLPAGDYDIVVTDKNGCTGNNTSTVPEEGMLEFELTSEDDICEGGFGSVQIENLENQSGSNSISYEWLQNGTLIPDQNNSFLTDLYSSNYTLRATNDWHCFHEETARVMDTYEYLPEGFSEAYVRDYGEHIVYHKIWLSSHLPADWNVITWQVNEENVPNSSFHDIMIILERRGNYSIDLLVESEHGCEYELPGSIEVYGQPAMYVPNAFIPLGYGSKGASDVMEDVNRTFAPVFVNELLFDPNSFEGYIYNRWGELVYEYQSMEDRWDGKIRGRSTDDAQEIETYVCVFKIVDRINGDLIEYKGNVTILK